MLIWKVSQIYVTSGRLPVDFRLISDVYVQNENLKKLHVRTSEIVIFTIYGFRVAYFQN